MNATLVQCELGVSLHILTSLYFESLLVRGLAEKCYDNINNNSGCSYNSNFVYPSMHLQNCLKCH